MTERQRKIEELKRGLLAPMIPPTRQQPIANPAPVGFNKLNRQEEEGKYNKVMDWGTPRLVTKNRALVMDQ